jgi:hypothetical protein
LLNPVPKDLLQAVKFLFELVVRKLRYAVARVSRFWMVTVSLAKPIAKMTPLRQPKPAALFVDQGIGMLLSVTLLKRFV